MNKFVVLSLVATVISAEFAPRFRREDFKLAFGEEDKNSGLPLLHEEADEKWKTPTRRRREELNKRQEELKAEEADEKYRPGYQSGFGNGLQSGFGNGLQSGFGNGLQSGYGNGLLNNYYTGIGQTGLGYGGLSSGYGNGFNQGFGYGYQPGSGFGGANGQYSNLSPLYRPSQNYNSYGLNVDLRKKEAKNRNLESPAGDTTESTRHRRKAPKGKAIEGAISFPKELGKEKQGYEGYGGQGQGQQGEFSGSQNGFEQNSAQGGQGGYEQGEQGGYGQGGQGSFGQDSEQGGEGGSQGGQSGAEGLGQEGIGGGTGQSIGLGVQGGYGGFSPELGGLGQGSALVGSYSGGLFDGGLGSTGILNSPLTNSFQSNIDPVGLLSSGIPAGLGAGYGLQDSSITSTSFVSQTQSGASGLGFGNGINSGIHGYYPGSGFGGANVQFANVGPLGRPSLEYHVPGFSVSLRSNKPTASKNTELRNKPPK
ncbi:hypothetical protein QYM36_012945 [Artemia franciscana]|uniref:Uncharacterized protein n=1 Tax=Artemia franciscana TaxID=6661 RepID=A0AA88HH54_ARTSF|nr:hypothetical protein QYM36_012945 [Artemia franciscana]